MPDARIVVDVNIAEASDVVAPVDPEDDGKALVRDSNLGKYKHVALPGLGGNVAYTDAANVFTRGQSIAAAIADLIDGGYLLPESLPNGDFATGDLTGWTDDGSGWNVVSNGGGYALSHASGSEGFLTQDVAGISGEVFVLQFTVTGLTTGYVDVYGTENLYLDIANNGTWRSIGYVASDPTTITIYVSSDFDGLITDASLKQSGVGFPPTLFLSDANGNINEIRISGSSFFWGPNAGKRASAGGGGGNIGFGDGALDSIYLEANNAAFGQGAGQGARCNGGLFMGPGTGQNETVDYRFYVGNNGNIMSGQLNFGDAATQTLKIHAATIDVSDLPTSPGATGTFWVDEANGGVVKRA